MTSLSIKRNATYFHGRDVEKIPNASPLDAKDWESVLSEFIGEDLVYAAPQSSKSLDAPIERAVPSKRTIDVMEMESNNSNHNQQRSLSYSLPTLLMLASEESHMSKVPAKPRPKPKKKFNGVRSGEGVGFGVCERCHRELKKRGCKYIFEGNAIFACGTCWQYHRTHGWERPIATAKEDGSDSILPKNSKR